MTNVVLQPAADSAAQDNLKKTISTKLSWTTLISLTSAASRDRVRRAARYHGGTHVGVWGTTPGASPESKRQQWGRVAPGDSVLFTWQKAVRTRATVVGTVHDETLAAALWGRRADGQTWEFVYFVDEIDETVDWDIKRLNVAAGYKPANVVQGFTVLSGTKADSIFDEFQLESVEFPSTAPEPGSVEPHPRRLGKRGKVTPEGAERMRQRAAEIGRIGETLVNAFLVSEQAAGHVDEFHWISATDAYAPYDFEVKNKMSIRIEVKSTTRAWPADFYVSVGELEQMGSHDGPTELWHVAECETTPKLRICKSTREMAKSALGALKTLPAGMVFESLRVSPNILKFAPPIPLQP